MLPEILLVVESNWRSMGGSFELRVKFFTRASQLETRAYFMLVMLAARFSIFHCGWGFYLVYFVEN